MDWHLSLAPLRAMCNCPARPHRTWSRHFLRTDPCPNAARGSLCKIFPTQESFDLVSWLPFPLAEMVWLTSLHHRSLVFYSGFLPLITILHACTDAALYFLSLLHPLYALVVSLIWFLGWAVQTAIWGICYGDGSYEQDVCPEWPLARRYKGGVPLARLAFAVLVTILYVGYVALAAAAVHRSRMASRRDGKQRATETGYVKEMGDM